MKLMAPAILHGISSDTLDWFVYVSQRSKGPDVSGKHSDTHSVFTRANTLTDTYYA